MRDLAQRTSEAARDIKALTAESADQVHKGVDVVGKTASALGEIVTQIKEISTLIEDVAQAADEQSLGLGELHGGMMELDQITQRNAAMSQQVTAAGQVLRSYAISLKQMVSSFKVQTQTAGQTQTAHRAA